VAINRAEVEFWRLLSGRGVLPQNPRVLEIGEANWFGDVPYADAPEITAGGGPGDDAFSAAKAFYRGVLGPRTTFTAVDLNGTERAIRHDLNEPPPADLFGGPFGLVINSGTAEHVLDQRRVFQTIHEAAGVGALMVHDAPSSGWPDHGFYNYQPCFFRDLAKANDYEVVEETVWAQQAKKPHGVMPALDLGILVALVKTRDAPFRVPRQGRYA
jgi:hypothetical protein